MTALILLASILGSISGGFAGSILWYRHYQESLKSSDPSIMDYFVGNTWIGAFLTLSLGAGGFWLPNTLLQGVIPLVETPIQDNSISDRTSPSNIPVIDAVPLED